MVYVLTLNNTFDYVCSTILIGVYSSYEKAEKEIKTREETISCPQDPPIKDGDCFYVGHDKSIRERREEWYEVHPTEVDKGLISFIE